MTITVLCCCPEKLKQKIICKGGGSITCIEEIKPPPPPPPPPPAVPIVQIYNVFGMFCGECYEGRCGGQCDHFMLGPIPCYGRPVYDSYGGGYRSCYVSQSEYFCM